LMNPTFISNHDMGRISAKIRDDHPGISQDELLKRVTLAQEVMIYLRGVPVIYSGDEQGFLSDGNDQLARENMFPSQVDVYNDNDLLGTNATTAESNFDTTHPIYTAIRDAAEIYKAHPALRHGKQVLRLSEEEGYVLAFSRFDPDTGHEYLVVANMGADARDVNLTVDPLSAAFESLDGPCPIAANTTGNVSIALQPFEIAVCRATTPSSRAGR